MEESKIIVTVSGTDKIGLVAAFANTLARHNINIEDIRQSIMQEYFVMMVMADITNATCSFQEIKEDLTKTGIEMEMEVWVQRKKIFDKMHTI